MAIPNLHVVANTNQMPCLDLVPANELAGEPICSWRSEHNPDVELKVTTDGEKIRYSVYNHHPNVRRYWPISPSSSMVFISVFTHCVWKSSGKVIESRLFGNGFTAVLVSFTASEKIIGIREWMDAYVEKFLIGNNPIVSAINKDNSLEFEEEPRETPRSRPYDPEAEEGIMRWRKDPKAKQAIITEETMKVWPGPRDIRLIKYVNGQREEILFRVFNWENRKNLEVPSRLASCASSSLSDNENIDTAIEKIQDYTPGLESVKNKEMITIYRQHPLNYFMPGYILSRTPASEVQRWIYEQFYRKEVENKQRFEYTNFVSAKKIAFSFAEGMRGGNWTKNDSVIEAWHVEMKRVAAWALQFPVAISNFFVGMFFANAQDPTLIDEKAMERLVQGVPLFDAETNTIVDDFAVELGACSTIDFYIACDRSISQLEINGRAWTRSFANAGKNVRGAVKITRNREEGTSTIEFRPRHGLSDIHGLGLFLEQKIGFAGCVVDVEQKDSFNGKELSYSSINLRNYQDLVRQRYEQIWEDRDPGNTEEYKIPNSGYNNFTMWPEKKKTVEQLEKELSYQERFLQRTVNIMNGKQKESDKVRPFDPAFKRIFMTTERECITNKIALPTIAGMTSIFFEYKTKTVPLDQERVCIAEINALPALTTDEVEEAIKADLREHPIEVVDLHQISHLLEELGGYAASSALIEREYTLDKKEYRCTAIVLRNRQDLVDERYQNLRKKYRGQYDLPIQAPKCKYPLLYWQRGKTSQKAQEQLSSQAQLLQRAVQKMYVQGRPFDPLFERIYIPTDQERLDNFASISNLAQTDMILFVYRTSEDRPPKYAVEDICESIRTMAEVEGRKIPVEEISTVSKIAQVCLPLFEGVAKITTNFFYATGRIIQSISHFFARTIGMIWQLFRNSLRPN